MRYKADDELYYSIGEALAAAKPLGIKITNAEIHTELCDGWAARVLVAKMCWDRGEMDACIKAIAGANAYAI